MPDLTQRLAALRRSLAAQSFDGFVLPRGDEYLGEYVPACSERLAWLTNFTGSAGLAVVLTERAAVFSDGRYTTQLEAEVDPALWERRHVTNEPPADWIKQNTAGGARIAYDPRIMSATMLEPFLRADLNMVALTGNPVDPIWNDRPAPPHGPAQVHPLAFAGVSSTDKRAMVAADLREHGDDAAIIGDSSSVAWLLNLRGTDVPYTPLLLAFAIIDQTGGVDLFVDADRLDTAVLAHLGDVRVHAPETLAAHLDRFSGQTVRVDPSATALWFSQTLVHHGAIVSARQDPCLLPKARKNPTEMAGARAAHHKDAVAMCRFLCWLDANGHGMRETALSDKLDWFRAQEPSYRGESFSAISGAGPNGAIIHYRAKPGADRTLAANEVYLIDSGGQYPEGTTDITRTVWSGPSNPPHALCEAYTRVLKGNLALSHVVFPVGTTGHRLDVLARAALWQVGLDYDHGTGHGVGSFLSVHEGPCNISSVPRPVPLEPGMIISNEPGFYRPGAFGMRLETLQLVVETQIGRDGRRFLGFETLTFAPWDRRLIDVTLLTAQELHALNSYHARVAEIVLPYLDTQEKQWIIEVCAPLSAG